MSVETLALIITIALILIAVFVAYKLARIPGDLDIRVLAICVLIMVGNVILLKEIAIFYLIFKLLFEFFKPENKEETK